MKLQALAHLVHTAVLMAVWDITFYELRFTSYVWYYTAVLMAVWDMTFDVWRLILYRCALGCLGHDVWRVAVRQLIYQNNQHFYRNFELATCCRSGVRAQRDGHHMSWSGSKAGIERSETLNRSWSGSKAGIERSETLHMSWSDYNCSKRGSSAARRFTRHTKRSTCLTTAYYIQH